MDHPQHGVPGDAGPFRPRQPKAPADAPFTAVQVHNGDIHLKETLRAFLFETAAALLGGGIRFGSFMLDTAERFRNVALELLHGLIADRKWFVLLGLVVSACWTSCSGNGFLWAVGDVAKSHICSLSASGTCSDQQLAIPAAPSAPALHTGIHPRIPIRQPFEGRRF